MMRTTLLLILLVVLFSSCQKNRLKKPTDVGFKFDITREPSTEGNLFFTSGTINIASFDVEGERTQGDDISFSKEFPNGLLINFDANNTISELDYDIPQGIYSSLSFSFETFDDNSDITITCSGTYINSIGTAVPVLFEFMSSESFSLEAEDDSGSSEIILDKDNPALGLIQLDPIYWFDIVPSSMLENATQVMIDGVSVIQINDSVNEGIYELIVSRIEVSTQITIES